MVPMGMLYPGQPLAQPTQTAAQYLTFSVTAWLAAVYTGSAADWDAVQLQLRQWALGIILPTQPTDAGRTQLHAQLDSTQLLMPMVAFTLIEPFSGAPSLISQASHPTSGFAVEIAQP